MRGVQLTCQRRMVPLYDPGSCLPTRLHTYHDLISTRGSIAQVMSRRLVGQVPQPLGPGSAFFWSRSSKPVGQDWQTAGAPSAKHLGRISQTAKSGQRLATYGSGLVRLLLRQDQSNSKVWAKAGNLRLRVGRVAAEAGCLCLCRVRLPTEGRSRTPLCGS